MKTTLLSLFFVVFALIVSAFLSKISGLDTFDVFSILVALSIFERILEIESKIKSN